MSSWLKKKCFSSPEVTPNLQTVVCIDVLFWKLVCIPAPPLFVGYLPEARWTLEAPGGPWRPSGVQRSRTRLVFSQLGGPGGSGNDNNMCCDHTLWETLKAHVGGRKKLQVSMTACRKSIFGHVVFIFEQLCDWLLNNRSSVLTVFWQTAPANTLTPLIRVQRWIID